jgi:tetratricopeptide (TPR) repeat protein
MKHVPITLKHVSIALIHVLFLASLHAAELQPAARALRTRGLHAYDVQDYASAIEAFRAAYQIDAQPELLYALAQAERMSGDCRRAIDAYRAFLRSNPPAAQATSARKNISRCESQLSAVAIGSPPPPEPSPAPAIPPPAETTVVAPPPPEPRRAARDTAGHVLMALGLAGLVTGSALWGVAQSQIDAANQAMRYDQFSAARAAASGAEGERIGGIVAVSIGGALTVAAVLRYAIGTRGR